MIEPHPFTLVWGQWPRLWVSSQMYTWNILAIWGDLTGHPWPWLHSAFSLLRCSGYLSISHHSPFVHSSSLCGLPLLPKPKIPSHTRPLHMLFPLLGILFLQLVLHQTNFYSIIPMSAKLSLFQKRLLLPLCPLWTDLLPVLTVKYNSHPQPLAKLQFYNLQT